MIESAKGVENVREIASVSGLGAIEPVHLSEADTQTVISICKEKGVHLATEAALEEVPKRIEEGYRLIHLGWDFNLLRRELEERIVKTREILQERQATRSR
jgi:hypothetical protein